MSPDFDDMARILGARPVTVVRTIHLPLVRPAIWGAALLVFIDCLKELPATLLLRPMNVETLSTYIYQYRHARQFRGGRAGGADDRRRRHLPVIRIVRYADYAQVARDRDRLR